MHCAVPQCAQDVIKFRFFGHCAGLPRRIANSRKDQRDHGLRMYVSPDRAGSLMAGAEDGHYKQERADP